MYINVSDVQVDTTLDFEIEIPEDTLVDTVLGNRDFTTAVNDIIDESDLTVPVEQVLEAFDFTDIVQGVIEDLRSDGGVQEGLDDIEARLQAVEAALRTIAEAASSF